MSTTSKPTKPELHVPRHPVRFVTAASLFDGHDAAINIMRRLLQAQGAAEQRGLYCRLVLSQRQINQQ